MRTAALVLLAFAIGASGCGKRKELRLPDRVEPGWQLAEKTASSAEYRGEGVIRVEIQELPSSSPAFERVQQFRPGDGRIAFYKDRFFFIASGAGQARLNEFAAAFEKALKIE